jgi:hypothetical protein
MFESILPKYIQAKNDSTSHARLKQVAKVGTCNWTTTGDDTLDTTGYNK